MKSPFEPLTFDIFDHIRHHMVRLAYKNETLPFALCFEMGRWRAFSISPFSNPLYSPRFSLRLDLVAQVAATSWRCASSNSLFSRAVTAPLPAFFRKSVRGPEFWALFAEISQKGRVVAFEGI